MAGRYDTLTKVEHYRIDLDTKAKKTKPLYVAWYDAINRQSCRRSLETENLEKAITIVRGLVDRGYVGDPSEGLRTRKFRPWTSCSTSTRRRSRNSPRPRPGTSRPGVFAVCSAAGELATLVKRDFENFRDACLAEGLALSTIDRTLSTLVAAIRDARANKLVKADEMPVVPENASPRTTCARPRREGGS